nr:hypothetical protein LRH_01213 [Lacticaseibacillus rhamnosus HN001]
MFSGFLGLGWKEKLFAEMTLQNSELVCKDPIGWWVGLLQSAFAGAEICV